MKTKLLLVLGFLCFAGFAAADTEPPAVENRNIVIGTVTSKTIPISWEAATDNVTADEDIKYYIVCIQTASPRELQGLGKADIINAAAGVVTGDNSYNVKTYLLSRKFVALSPNTSYGILVMAVDEAGNETIYAPVIQKTSAADVVPVITVDFAHICENEPFGIYVSHGDLGASSDPWGFTYTYAGMDPVTVTGWGPGSAHTVPVAGLSFGDYDFVVTNLINETTGATDPGPIVSPFHVPMAAAVSIVPSVDVSMGVTEGTVVDFVVTRVDSEYTEGNWWSIVYKDGETTYNRGSDTNSLTVSITAGEAGTTHNLLFFNIFDQVTFCGRDFEVGYSFTTTSFAPLSIVEVGNIYEGDANYIGFIVDLGSEQAAQYEIVWADGNFNNHGMIDAGIDPINGFILYPFIASDHAKLKAGTYLGSLQVKTTSGALTEAKPFRFTILPTISPDATTICVSNPRGVQVIYSLSAEAIGSQFWSVTVDDAGTGNVNTDEFRIIQGGANIVDLNSGFIGVSGQAMRWNNASSSIHFNLFWHATEDATPEKTFVLTGIRHYLPTDWTFWSRARETVTVITPPHFAEGSEVVVDLNTDQTIHFDIKEYVANGITPSGFYIEPADTKATIAGLPASRTLVNGTTVNYTVTEASDAPIEYKIYPVYKASDGNHYASERALTLIISPGPGEPPTVNIGVLGACDGGDYQLNVVATDTWFTFGTDRWGFTYQIGDTKETVTELFYDIHHLYPSPLPAGNHEIIFTDIRNETTGAVNPGPLTLPFVINPRPEAEVICHTDISEGVTVGDELVFTIERIDSQYKEGDRWNLNCFYNGKSEGQTYSTKKITLTIAAGDPGAVSKVDFTSVQDLDTYCHSKPLSVFEFFVHERVVECPVPTDLMVSYTADCGAELKWGGATWPEPFGTPNTGYGYKSSDNTFVVFDLDDPLGTMVSRPSPIVETLLGGEYYNGKLYAFGKNKLYIIDPITLLYTSIATTRTMRDMAYDYTTETMYGIDSQMGWYLCSVDLNTGVATEIGNLGLAGPFTALAVDPSGNMYAVHANSINGNANFYSIDKTTAKVTYIGWTGHKNISGSNYQSMGFDHTTGDLYFCQYFYNYESSFCKINPATGVATIIAEDVGRMNCFFIPHKYDVAEYMQYNVYRDGDLVAEKIAKNAYGDTGFDPEKGHQWSVRTVCEGDQLSDEAVINEKACSEIDAYLAELTIAPGDLAPVFVPATTDYFLTVAHSVTAVTIHATANRASSSVSGLGDKSLSVGDNTFTVKVTASDGTTTKNYNIVVTRMEAPTPGACDMPKNLTVSYIADCAAELTWDTDDDGAAKLYNVYRDGGLIAEKIEIMYFVDDSFDADASHTWTVQAYCAGDGWSEEIAVSKEACAELDTYTIEASISGEDGTITPSGTVPVKQGEDQAFTFTPAEGNYVKTVTVNGAMMEPTPATSYLFEDIRSHGAINIEFGKLPAGSFAVIHTLLPIAGGIISGATFTTAGLDYTFTVTPNESYMPDEVFYRVGSATPQTIEAAGGIYTIPAAEITDKIEVIAKFTKKTYTIESSIASGAGTITPFGTIAVNHGADMVFVFTPGDGYKVSSVKVNGATVEPTPAASYQFKNIQADGAISVAFEKGGVDIAVVAVTAGIKVFIQGDVLCVSSPSAERINLYTVAGIMIYSGDKPVGEIHIPLSNVPRGFLIVKGSTGWAKKLIKR